MHDEPRSNLLGKPVAEFEHLFELVTRINVEKGKGEGPGVKRLAHQMNEHARILANRIQQDRIPELRYGFPQDVNRFAFKLAKMSPVMSDGCKCKPHSFELDSFHHRPARLFLSVWTARLEVG